MTAISVTKARENIIRFSLLPALDCTLRCGRTPEEIRSILRIVTVEKGLTEAEGGEFVGTVSECGFEITPKLWYRNSFVPIIKGRFVPDGEAVLIHVRMRMHTFVTGFSVFWFGGVFLFLLAGGLYALQNGMRSAFPMIIQSILMLALGQATERIAFHRPAKAALKRLKELLQGTEVSKK